MLHRETKFFIWFFVAMFFIIAIWLMVYSPASTPKPEVYEDNRPERGNANASVVITNYFDFTCSHCREAETVLNEVFKQYGQQVKIQYRYYPISERSTVLDAASECAQRQGKFWEYHDLLFSSQAQVKGLAELQNFAALVGLDQKKFTQCLQDQETSPVVVYDANQGMRLGVTGTPTIFVNGDLVDFQNLLSVISRLVVTP